MEQTSRPQLRAHPSLQNLADDLAGAHYFYNLIIFVFAVALLVAGAGNARTVGGRTA